MASWPEFRPTQALRALVGGDVDFVVIGGLAVVVHGHIRTTRDVDITYDPAPANLDALGRVLIGLDARLRGVEEAVPFVPHGRALQRTQILNLDTDVGWIDLLAAPPGAPPYRKLREQAETIDLDGVAVRVASLEDLIAMKAAAGRLQDQADIEALEAISRLRKSAQG